MASGLLALFDDIALLMDDMATMSQVATKKTAGILGDDLAVAAEQASGSSASRELAVLWAIFKGSVINKVIILPLAFLLSAFAPFLIIPILLFGGLYLAFEGMEKIYDFFFHKKQNKNTSKKDHDTTNHEKTKENTKKDEEERLLEEKNLIRSAIRTDFILSIEIIVLVLSTVSESTFMVQIGVVTFVSLLATVGIYGLVAMLVRIDDLGLRLVNKTKDTKAILHKLGKFLIAALPQIIRALGAIGTIAMLLVAGGIFVHNIHAIHELATSIPQLPFILAELLVGSIVGILAVIPVQLYKALFS